MANSKTKAEKQAELKQPEVIEQVAQVAPVQIEQTSEKLEQLNADKLTAMKAAQSLEIGTKEAEAAFFEVYKIGEDIKREIAAIKKHEAELLAKEKQAAIIKVLDDQNEAYIKSQADGNNPKLSLEEKQVSYDAWKASYEVVVNRLLGSRQASTATKTASAGTRGATSSEIRQMILDGLAKGQSIIEVKADIKAAGYARGTVDTTATNMKKAGEIDY